MQLQRKFKQMEQVSEESNTKILHHQLIVPSSCVLFDEPNHHSFHFTVTSPLLCPSPAD